ncbi:MAG: hypothetical protein AB7O24_23960 [Kofleriaceae bacterium]
MLPAALAQGIAESARERTEAWWMSLPEGIRAELVQLCDERAEATGWYGSVVDGELHWHELPIELRGALVDEENDPEHRMFKQQLLEYISNHEEVQFFLADGSFHICRAHPAARAVICSGLLPARFECPIADQACPMRTIIAAAGGRSVTLSVGLARGRCAGPTTPRSAGA